MQRDLTPQDLLPLIVEYLKSIGLKKSAKQIDSLYEHDETPLVNKDLETLVKYYIEAHPKLASKFIGKEEEEEEEVEEEKQQKQNVKSQPLTKPVSEKRTFSQLNDVPYIPDTPAEPREKKKFFQKCDDSAFDRLPTHLQDNTYEAKQRFGGGDAYGEFGNEKLKNQRGDNFKKEKGKLKNRQFQGMGSINLSAINSIKL